MDTSYETRKILLEITESTETYKDFPVDAIDNFTDTFKD